jgi:type IV pilus assembly protein PilC
MPVYKYNAVNDKGERRSGTVDAKTKDQAIGLLKREGLFVVSLDKAQTDILKELLSFRGIPQDAVVTFTRQFSTMISAGLPLSRSLEVLISQTENYKFKKVLSNILKDVEGGLSLSDALARHPNVFSATYQALVKAGEASGNLHTVLNRLAETMEDERELKSKFRSAMIYPAIVVIAMVGVFVLMMVLVIPNLTSMYEDLDVPLPVPTKIMIAISNFMTQNTILMILLVAAVIVALRYFKNTDYGERLLTEISFKLPVFGKINRNKEITSFARTLSLLINSAIPIVEALNIVSTVVNSHELEKAVDDAGTYVEQGNSLSEFFRGNEAFPPLLGQMAGVGEETGKMDEVLERVANYYEGETSSAIENLSAALEPIILVMLGSMVGILIVSIITPIYNITTSL